MMQNLLGGAKRVSSLHEKESTPRIVEAEVSEKNRA